MKLENLTRKKTEQEKKMLAPMLAKLHISPASSHALIREVYTDISEAVDDKKLGLDATGRNSLYKIHVSLGKIVNALDKEAEKVEKEGGIVSRMSSVAPSAAGGSASVAGGEENDVSVLEKTPEVDEDEDTIVPTGGEEKGKGRQITEELVDELLSDDDVDMSGT